MRDVLRFAIEPPAPDLADRVMAAVAAEPEPHREPRRHRALGLVAVALTAALSPGDRAALWLRFGEDLSIEQVAAVLGISPSAAKARIYRAAGRLRPAMRVGEAQP